MFEACIDPKKSFCGHVIVHRYLHILDTTLQVWRARFRLLVSTAQNQTMLQQRCTSAAPKFHQKTFFLWATRAFHRKKGCEVMHKVLRARHEDLAKHLYYLRTIGVSAAAAKRFKQGKLLWQTSFFDRWLWNLLHQTCEHLTWMTNEKNICTFQQSNLDLNAWK